MENEFVASRDALPAACEAPVLAKLFVDVAISCGKMRPLQGTSGMPGPAIGAEQIPDISEVWKSARVGLVRSYDWVSRLDTVDNPNGLFPKWSADPGDPANYNFEATDAWVRQAQDIGAEILFTIASSVPTSRRPASDLRKYEQVVENLVRHYVKGWGGGFTDAITYWEFGDQPDFGKLHFDGSPLEFFEMYEAAARAVKRVDRSLKFGGPCIAFPLNEGAYREGLLEYIRECGLPLDFYSWMWFADDSRDPLDFQRVAADLRKVLDRNGFGGSELLLSYWNMTGIPNAKIDDAEAAAFQAAAAIYLQDSVTDRAIFFRGDTGTDLHYNIIDPAGMFGPDGAETARTAVFRFVGKTFAASTRLAVRGGDEHGFAVLAGHDEPAETVRILIADYAIPDVYLTARDRDVFEFQVPIGEFKCDMSFTVPPRRVDARNSELGSYCLEVTNLPWGDSPHEVVRFRADGTHRGEVVESTVGVGPGAVISGPLGRSAVELVEIRRVANGR